MLIQSSFWTCMGVSAAAAFVGTIVEGLLSMAFNEYRRMINKKRYQRKDIAIAGVGMLVIAAVAVAFTLPISHWFEICLVSAGLSGLAFRWPALRLGDYIHKRVRKSREWTVYVVVIATPLLIISPLVSIVNHYWWKLF